MHSGDFSIGPGSESLVRVFGAFSNMIFIDIKISNLLDILRKYDWKKCTKIGKKGKKIIFDPNDEYG